MGDRPAGDPGQRGALCRDIGVRTRGDDGGGPAFPPVRDAAGRAWDDPGRAREARALGNATRSWWAIDLAVAAIGLGAMVATGAHVALRDALEPAGLEASPRLAFGLHAAAVVTALALAGAVAGVPAAWFGGHRLLKAHGLVTQGARGWARDYAVATALGTALAAAFGLVVASLAFGNPGA